MAEKEDLCNSRCERVKMERSRRKIYVVSNVKENYLFTNGYIQIEMIKKYDLF